MRLTINVKDQKLDFFLELLQNFEDFVTVEAAQDSTEDNLTEEQKALLEERLNFYKNNPDSLLSWKDVKTEIEQTL